MMSKGEYLKAIWSGFTAGVIAFLSSLLTAVQGETPGFDTITAGQWIVALLAFFVAATGTGKVTYQVTNRLPKRSEPDPSPESGDRPNAAVQHSSGQGH
jgi:hypothetical protein